MTRNTAGGMSRLQRRVLAAALTLLCAGAISSLEIGEARAVRSPVFAVTARYDGGFAETVERRVTRPIETAAAELSDVVSIHAVSSRELSEVVLRYDARTEPDQAYLELRAAIHRLIPRLPDSAHHPRIIRSDRDSSVVMILALRTHEQAVAQQVRAELLRIPGAADVVIGGERPLEATVTAGLDGAARTGQDLRRLPARVRGIAFTGGFSTAGSPPTLIDTRFRSREDLASAPVLPNSTLRSIADVSTRRREPDRTSQLNGEDRTLIYVQAEGDANPVAVAGRLVRAISAHPELEVVMNRAEAPIAAVRRAGLHSAGWIAAVIVVLFTVARNATANKHRFAADLLGAAVSSVAAGLAGMGLFGISLDPTGVYAVTCAALAVSLARALHSDRAVEPNPGLLPLAAAATAYLPMILLPANTRTLALPVVVGTTAALLGATVFFALRRLNPTDSAQHQHPATHQARTARTRITGPYAPPARSAGRVRWSFEKLRNTARLVTVSAAVLLFIGAVAGAVAPRRGFESGRAGEITAVLEFPAGLSRGAVFRRAQPVEHALIDHPAITTLAARFESERVRFDIGTDRRVGAAGQLISDLRRIAEKVPEAYLALSDEARRRHGYRITITGGSHQDLRRAAYRLADTLRNCSACDEVVLGFKGPPDSFVFQLELEKLARSGLSPADLAATIGWGTGQRVLTKWYPEGLERDVRLTLNAAAAAAAEPVGNSSTVELLEPRDFLSLQAVSTGGEPVALRELGSLQPAHEIQRLYRTDRRNAVRISVYSHQDEHPFFARHRARREDHLSQQLHKITGAMQHGSEHRYEITALEEHHEPQSIPIPVRSLFVSLPALLLYAVSRRGEYRHSLGKKEVAHDACGLFA